MHLLALGPNKFGFNLLLSLNISTHKSSLKVWRLVADLVGTGLLTFFEQEQTPTIL
jgi:hypothetical protein